MTIENINKRMRTTWVTLMGHSDVIKWLHDENRTENCPAVEMSWRDVIKYSTKEELFTLVKMVVCLFFVIRAYWYV